MPAKPKGESLEFPVDSNPAETSQPSDAPDLPVTKRTPEEGQPRAAVEVDVPPEAESDDSTKDVFTKHYIVQMPKDGKPETEANDMIDSALRLGLRPTGDPKQVSVEDHPTGGQNKIVTWEIPVEISETKQDVLLPRDETQSED